MKKTLTTLSSDQLGLNAITEGVQGALGAFTAFEGVMALSGSTSEELQKSILRVQGAMALLTGTQQLAKTLTKENAFLIGIETAARKVYNVVVGQSVGALRAFRLAAAATGIGLLVFGIIELVRNWEKLKFVLGNDVNPELQKNVDLTAKSVEAGKQENEMLQIKIEKYKLLGIGAAFINELEVEGAKKRLDELDAQVKANDELLKAKQAIRDFDLSDANTKVVGSAARVVRGEVRVSAEDIKELKANLAEVTKLREEQRNTVLKLTQEGREIEKDSLLESLQFEIDKLEAADADSIAARRRYWERIKSTNDDGTKEWRQAVVNLIKIDTELRKRREDEQKKEAEALAKKREIIKKHYDEIIADRRAFGDKLQGVLNQIDSANVESLTGEEKILAQGAANDEALTLLENSLKDELRALEISGQEKIALTAQIDERIGELRTQNEQNIQKELQEQRDAQNEAALSEAERHELAMAQIKKKGEEEIIKIQIDQAQKRLDALVAAGKGELQEAINLRNKLIELNAQLDDQTKTDAEKRNEVLKAGIISVYEATADAIQKTIDIQIRATDLLISLQQERVDAAKGIAEKGNAEILQLEEERLTELTRKRERFVRAQQALAAIQLVSESALAIAKAAAQGGAAAPFTIAATLIALAAGLAQARALASQAAFYEGGPANWSDLGGYTGSGNPRSQSSNRGKKPYTYHREEYIMPHPTHM